MCLLATLSLAVSGCYQKQEYAVETKIEVPTVNITSAETADSLMNQPLRKRKPLLRNQP